jgi:TRAP-type mannitol/chloroaromatic compound transport system permease large subunit
LRFFKLISLNIFNPFGLNLFTVLAASDEPIPTGELYRSFIPFIVFDLITSALLVISKHCHLATGTYDVTVTTDDLYQADDTEPK